MRLTQIISINAILSIAIGIAFGLNSPLMLAIFEISETPSQEVVLYWTVASFSRMYGITLMGYGILLWSTRKLLDQIEDRGVRGIVFALIIANVLGLYTAITQQVANWQTFAGWVLSFYYLLFVFIYIYVLVKEYSRDTSKSQDKQ